MMYEWNIPVCLWNGLNMVGVTTLRYLSALYLWLLVVLIIVVSRYSTKISNLTFGSSVQVLVTLMYISFSELFQYSIVVLTLAYIHMDTNGTISKQLVWYTDGSVHYGQDLYHIALMCVSVAVILLFIVPFIAIGLFGVKLFRFRLVIKYLRPFIDAIHGPYKDNRKHWFGLRLVVLTLLYIIAASLEGNDATLQLVLSTFIIVSFTLSQSLALPYKNKLLNALDLWFSVLLLIELIISSSCDSDTSSHIVTSVLITLCFLTYSLIISYHIFRAVKQLRCARKCLATKLFYKYSRENDSCLPPLIDENREQDNDDNIY